MSVLFFRTPGFDRGCPRGRRHAAFGISSAVQGAGASAEKKEVTISSNGRYLFIGPPKVADLLRTDSSRCKRKAPASESGRYKCGVANLGASTVATILS